MCISWYGIPTAKNSILLQNFMDEKDGLIEHFQESYKFWDDFESNDILIIFQRSNKFKIFFQRINCFLWGRFMKLWIFLDVCFNHYKVEVILTTHII
jgi:hypothetical protein